MTMPFSMRSTKTPANSNGSARPDGNPKTTTQDQSPERGCGSYSHCVALSGVVSFPPSGFSFSANASHRATQWLLFRWCMIHKKVPKFHRFFCTFSGLLSLRKYGNIQLPQGKKQKTDALSRGRMLPEANGYADTGF